MPAGSAHRPASLAELAADRSPQLPLADPTVVPAADVRTAMAYVALGEAPAGMVFTTDAATTPAVEVALRIPSEATVPIVHPIALTKRATAADRALYNLLRSAEARRAFAAVGFTAPLARAARDARLTRTQEAPCRSTISRSSPPTSMPSAQPTSNCTA